MRSRNRKAPLILLSELLADLLEIFDKHIRARSYTNRSEAIRDLIRKAFVKKEWQADKPVMGVISLVYDHHARELAMRLIGSVGPLFVAAFVARIHVSIVHFASCSVDPVSKY
jgi:metal-responsive CopG/Arc/MetJ family transcriptional regulator